MFETTKALILREVRYKESDRILTVLTDTDGKRTLKARGALRKGSKTSRTRTASARSRRAARSARAAKWRPPRSSSRFRS